MSQVFELDFVKAFHLRSRSPGELTQKLAPSHAKYNGKDALVVVIKERTNSHAFFNLEGQPSVRTIAFNQLCPRTPNPPATHASAESSPSKSMNIQQESYTPAEIEITIKFQRMWRSCAHKIKIRRSYMQLPEARAIAHFISLGAQLPATLSFIDGVVFQDTLISKGVAMSLRLAVARDTLSRLQKDAMTCVEKVDISAGLFESVDDALRGNAQVESLIRKADETMSDDSIAEVVKMGVLAVLEKVLKNVEDSYVEAQQAMSETRKILDTVFSSCT